MSKFFKTIFIILFGIAIVIKLGTLGYKIFFKHNKTKCETSFINDSYSEALKYCTQQAKNNDHLAQVILATIYIEGLSVEKNYEKAEKLCTSALESTNDKAVTLATFELGMLYEKIDFEKYNLKKSASWYKKAADNGHKESEYIYGYMLTFGYGVKKNREVAKIYLSKASKQGMDKAKKVLDLIKNEKNKK